MIALYGQRHAVLLDNSVCCNRTPKVVIPEIIIRKDEEFEFDLQ